MKVSRIEIKDFHQFKDFSLDLTYPSGHAKAGQPLDKVCFIGQSGTGKTTLLELVQILLFHHRNNLSLRCVPFKLVQEVALTFEFNSKISKVTLRFLDEKEKHWLNSDINQQHKRKFSDATSREQIDKEIKNSMYFPSNLYYQADKLGQEKNTIINKTFIDFGEQNIAEVWNLILDKIQEYQEKELQIRQEISRTVEKSSNDIEAIETELKKLKEWKKEAFNPIKDLADKCLNELLEPFKLRVKTELDIKTKDDIGFIKIEDYNGNEIPMGLWSTGTKQIVLSAMPLYLLKPKNTLIFFDEPERSLYPDLQRMIIDFYTSLTDNCQFMFATHSPIIASSFDPWEIVELKFDKNFKVYREQYYEGENHVDNYKWNPKYMRWDDILQRVFDMENDGSEERRKKLDELATQNVKLRKLQKDEKNDSQEAKQIVDKVQKLAKELSVWD